MRPSGSAIRTATSYRAPATTPAGSTAWRRPPWSCAPASTASATTRTRTSDRNGRRPGPTCCSTRWWRRRRSYREHLLVFAEPATARRAEDVRGVRFMTTLIKSGTIVTADMTYPADLLIDGEKIVAIGQDL